MTLLSGALPDVVDVSRFRGKRVLEVGPKYGAHSLWIDRELEPSELVFCDFAEVSALHLDGTMLLQSTVDDRRDAVVWLHWQPTTGKAKAVPSVTALRTQLAWTGWRKVTRFTNYRPRLSQALFLCEKTDELSATTGLAPVVAPHRGDVA